MISRATPRFWECYDILPRQVKDQAQVAYRLWQEDPFHRGLEFKWVKGTKHPIRSVRIGLHWRALGVERDGVILWFWIGSHSEYDRLIANS
jgi:hypothetical protein